MQFEETIAAISTPPGFGAIAVVRMSGPAACQILSKLFSPSGKKRESDWLRTHLATLGSFSNPETGQEVDQVLVTPFLAPHSYTSEDVVEISCHGSPLIASEVLALCLKHGARLAKPGEFTQRAFLSGKLDLTQAEAVLDLIQSKTRRQSRAALSVLSGDLGRRIRDIRKNLVDLLANVTAGIDFPEEVGDTPEPDIHFAVAGAIEVLTDLSDAARANKFLRDGLRLAIVGRPNVGKSSLLNQFLKIERAIVTDVPGTTRDSLEEFVDLDGLPVVVIDTAGLRQSDDAVELIGMERTKRAIEDSELVLFLIDITAGWQKEDERVLETIGSRPFLLLKNKCDLHGKDLPSNGVADRPGKIGELLISAKTGEKVKHIHEMISDWAFQGRTRHEGDTSLNDRQAALCEAAIASLNLVTKTVQEGLPQDCLATDLKGAIDHLSEICGEMVSEEIIASVFANFCIGK
jgi:tRNA modification GTPase